MEQQPSRLLSGLEALLEGKRGAMAVNALIVALVILALLLPPVSAQERILEPGYTSIDRQEGGSVVDADGTQLTLLPEGLTEDVRVREQSVPMASFLDGSAGSSLKEAAKALPSTLLVKSPIYEIRVKGAMPTAAVLTIPIPNNAEPYETLSLYHWTGEQWEFLPSQIIMEDDVIESHLSFLPETVAVVQCAAQPAQVSAELPGYVSLPELGDQALAELNPVGYGLGPDNTVEGSLTSLPRMRGQESYQVSPTLRNWTDDGVVRSDLVDNMLVAEESRAAHVQAILNLVVKEMYGGVDLDYRGIDPALRNEYTAFVQALAQQLHDNGKRLAVRVEAPNQIAADRWETGAYDWAALGLAADEFKFPALPDPAAYAPGGAMEALLWWAVGQVDRYKLQPVLSARSIEKAGGALLPLTYRDALSKLSQVAVKAGGGEVMIPGQQVTVGLETPGIQQDAATGQFWFVYQDEASGEQRSVYLEDVTSMGNKLALLSRFGLGGVAIRDLWDEANDPRLWDLVRQYQASPQALPTPAAGGFSVKWWVEDSSGDPLTEETRHLSQGDYVWTAPQEPGIYQIGAVILANDGRTAAEGQKLAFVVELPTPTPTPTPSPTPIPPTPTPEPPTPTPTPIPPTPTSQPKAQAVGTPKPTATPKSSNPPVNTNFGYGIQAHMIDNGQAGIVMDKIKDLGFGWVKQQVEWKSAEPSKGSYNWGQLDAIAAEAAGRGIKVLWSVVKAPAWAREGQDMSVEGPPNNPQDFADFLGAMAGHFCNSSVKAIEVWNEQNLHYEWGNKKIDPAAYIALLKPAYGAIKQACPGMIVVSGALTPTGMPPPKAMDDFTYLEGMYKAGLKDYCDAVGAHPSGYNVSPDVRGGQAACDFITQQGSSFRGPCQTLHHSWSFNATLNGYYNIMKKYGDGNKKIWPTEFGWASGWTGAPGYEYADDNTLEEQAAWTVQSYKLMKQWGFVGVAFLWNLNFRVVNPTGEVAQWGIVAPDWSPLPAYNQLKAMTK